MNNGTMMLIGFKLNTWSRFSRLAITSAVVVLLSACTESNVPDAELVKTYADVVMARQTIADSAKLRQTLDSILTAHNLDSAEFAQKLREMSKTPECLKGFYDSVTTKLSR